MCVCVWNEQARGGVKENENNLKSIVYAQIDEDIVNKSVS